MTDFDFQTDLAGLDDAFKGADVLPEQGELPKGKYQFLITKCYLDRSSDETTTLLKWCLQVVGSDHAGQVVWRNNRIVAESLQYLKTDLDRVGIQLEKVSDLKTRAQELVGRVFEGAVVHKDGYQNIYVNKLITTGVAVPESGDHVDLGAGAGAGSIASGAGAASRAGSARPVF